MALWGGIDEVGRGAWAGPLVVGFVIGDSEDRTLGDLLRRPARDRSGDDQLVEGQFFDSKALQPRRREATAVLLSELVVAYGFGSVSSAEIDTFGLSVALTLGAQRAIESVDVVPERIVLDGPVDYLPKRVGIEVVTSPRGDTRSSVVAAASILAKVWRDAEMTALSDDIPYFDFERNKGYPAPAHLRGLAAVGPSVYHRGSWSFGPKLHYHNPYLSVNQTVVAARSSPGLADNG